MTKIAKCPHCGSEKMVTRGPSYQCKNCGKYTKFSSEKNVFRSNGLTAEVDAVVEERVKNEKDAVRVCKIDTDEWRVERWTCGVDEGWRKDRQVEWKVRDTKVIKGDVHDTGKLITKQVYRVKLWLVRKTAEIRTQKAIEELLKDAAKKATKVSKIRYPKAPDKLVYEIDFPDLHFGRLAWSEETGKDYDVKIARQAVDNAIARLLSYANRFQVSRILFPAGSDFFNVDNKHDTTVNGTPQQEDTRWTKTFNLGREMACSMIDKCQAIAPVDVIIIPGNHDEQRSFYMGAALWCYYHNNPNVTVNNKARPRKYWSFGSNLICFTHGCYEPINELPTIMATEEPLLWGGSKTRECHLGHTHKTKKLENRVDEKIGVTIRVLRSLSAPDAWTFNHGFVGAVRAAEGFLWHPTEGLVAQFTAIGE